MVIGAVAVSSLFPPKPIVKIEYKEKEETKSKTQNNIVTKTKTVIKSPDGTVIEKEESSTDLSQNETVRKKESEFKRLENPIVFKHHSIDLKGELNKNNIFYSIKYEYASEFIFKTEVFTDVYYKQSIDQKSNDYGGSIGIRKRF